MANDEHRHDTAPAPADCCGPCDCGAEGGWQAQGQPRKTALHVFIYCSVAGCTNSQAVGFASESETYGELLAMLRHDGWVLQVMSANVEEARCPPCERALQARVSQIQLAER